MKHSFEVELREAGGELHGVVVTEGRAASGGRRELFAPGSLSWPSDGVEVTVGHGGAPELRAHPARLPDGRIALRAKATAAIREAVQAGARFMSLEFVSLRERTTRGGVREILRAFMPAAAIVDRPEYDVSAAEIRSRKGRPDQRRAAWL